MLISVITVCYNCEDKIKMTLESVKKQNFNDYEYIVIDGSSTDATFSTVKKFEKQFQNMRAISEPDHGIYDAMNKGVQNASGRYVYFLNAGDTFYNDSVLSNVAKYLVEDRDVYYGNSKKGDKIESYPSRLSIFYLVWREKMVCHQAIFAKRKLFEKVLFDITYRICADRKWMLACLKKGITYRYMSDLVICDFEIGGVSSVYSNFADESLKIAKEYAGNIVVPCIRLKRKAGSYINRRQ